MPDTKTDRGWYPDPDGGPQQRLWDGSRWTVHYAPARSFLDRKLGALDKKPVREPRRLVFTALVVSAIFATGFGACAYVASQFNFSIGPQRLDPIAVPRTSCPYLRRVHDAAARAGAAWGATHNESDPKAWNGQAASLGRTLEAFELALRGAVPHVPAQIATNLQEVQVYVAVGRTELSRARRGIDYSARTFGTVTSGYRSLSDASDLTGNACGFTLAPNPDVALSQTTVGSR